MTKKNDKKRSIDKNRRYDAYFARLAKKMNMSTTGAVNEELDKMLRFVIQEFGATAMIILKNYVKKDTVKPNMAYTTLNAMLTGDLRTDVLAAGSTKLVAFLKESEKQKTGACEDTAVAIDAETVVGQT